jgi:hypothetical protein
LLQAVLEQHPVFLSLLRLPEERVKIPTVVAVGAQAHLMEPAVAVVAPVVVAGLDLMVLGATGAAVRVFPAQILRPVLQVVAAVGRKGRGRRGFLLVVMVLVVPVAGLTVERYKIGRGIALTVLLAR